MSGGGTALPGLSEWAAVPTSPRGHSPAWQFSEAVLLGVYSARRHDPSAPWPRSQPPAPLPTESSGAGPEVPALSSEGRFLGHHGPHPEVTRSPLRSEAQVRLTGIRYEHHRYLSPPRESQEGLSRKWGRGPNTRSFLRHRRRTRMRPPRPPHPVPRDEAQPWAHLPVHSEDAVPLEHALPCS